MEQNEIKADIAGMLARLLARPDEELVSALNSGELGKALNPYLNLPGPAAGFPDGGYTLDGLTAMHDKTMGPASRRALLPVESLFKLWCDDEGSHPSNAARGLLMGDPAMHMLELYRRYGIEVPAEFSGQPDHLVLELEFLSMLYEKCSVKVIERFIMDHLDWVPDLLMHWREMKVPEFYLRAAGTIDIYLEKEMSGFRCYPEVHA